MHSDPKEAILHPREIVERPARTDYSGPEHSVGEEFVFLGEVLPRPLPDVANARALVVRAHCRARHDEAVQPVHLGPEARDFPRIGTKLRLQLPQEQFLPIIAGTIHIQSPQLLEVLACP